MKMKKQAAEFQIKSIEADGTFTGYGSVFGNEDSYGDVVVKGAFSKTLAAWKAKARMPALLWQHNSAEPIGVWEEMSEDDNGLLVKGRLLIHDDPLAKRAYAHLKAGSVGGLSIGYSVPKGGGSYDEKAGVYRLTEVKLFETSLVTFPANEAAQVETVKAADFIDDIRETELILRDAGFSKTQACKLLAGGWNALQGTGEPVSKVEKTGDQLTPEQIRNFFFDK